MSRNILHRSRKSGRLLQKEINHILNSMPLFPLLTFSYKGIPYKPYCVYLATVSSGNALTLSQSMSAIQFRFPSSAGSASHESKSRSYTCPMM